VNLVKAVSWFEKGAAWPDWPSALGLARANWRGEGVKVDKEKAMTLWRQLSDWGCGAAMWKMGTVYRDGDGVEMDKQVAFTWFRKAADAGCVEAFSCLARAYAHGEGVERDPREASRCLDRAAGAS
jgi:TPR repeat protein